MPRSPHNKAHFKAMAMLLGAEWWYDTVDHTFNNISTKRLEDRTVLDADTMEPINYTVHNSFMDRAARVTAGEIGHQDTQLEQANGRRTYP